MNFVCYKDWLCLVWKGSGVMNNILVHSWKLEGVWMEKLSQLPRAGEPEAQPGWPGGQGHCTFVPVPEGGHDEEADGLV